MWYLEEFDKKTTFMVNSYLLSDMTTEIVKEILGVEDVDHEIPVAYGQTDVPLSKVSKFSPYLQGPFSANENYEYEVGFSAD